MPFWEGMGAPEPSLGSAAAGPGSGQSHYFPAAGNFSCWLLPRALPSRQVWTRRLHPSMDQMDQTIHGLGLEEESG